MVTQPKVRQHDIISTAGCWCNVFVASALVTMALTVLHYEVSSVVGTV